MRVNIPALPLWLWCIFPSYLGDDTPPFPPAAPLPALSHVKCINTAAHHRHVGPARSSAQQRRFWCALLLRGTDENFQNDPDGQQKPKPQQTDNSCANPSHRSLSQREWAGTSTRARRRAESSALWTPFVSARGTKRLCGEVLKTPASEWLISSSSICKKVAQIFTALDNSKLLSGPLLQFFFVVFKSTQAFGPMTSHRFWAPCWIKKWQWYGE